MHAYLSSQGQNREAIFYNSLKHVSNVVSIIYLSHSNALFLIKVVLVFIVSFTIIGEVEPFWERGLNMSSWNKNFPGPQEMF